MRNRLAKVLAAAGVASRRNCEELIFAGKVKVNGEVMLYPQHPTCLDEDEVLVNGKKIEGIEEKVYFVLNKPLGTLCSNAPPKRGTRVIDLFEGVTERLFTIGRLDRDTTGLLLVTNDGMLANKIIHPSSGIQKEYLAKVEGEITAESLGRLERGCEVEGTFVRPLKVSRVRSNGLKIVVGEGKKREVRVMLEHARLPVLSLQRTRIGNLQLGGLPVGNWRQVSCQYCEKVFG